MSTNDQIQDTNLGTSQKKVPGMSQKPAPTQDPNNKKKTSQGHDSDDSGQEKNSGTPGKSLPSLKSSPRSPHSPRKEKCLHHHVGANENYGVGAHAVNGQARGIPTAKTPGVSKGLDRSNSPTRKAQTIPNPNAATTVTPMAHRGLKTTAEEQATKAAPRTRVPIWYQSTVRHKTKRPSRWLSQMEANPIPEPTS